MCKVKEVMCGNCGKNKVEVVGDVKFATCITCEVKHKVYGNYKEKSMSWEEATDILMAHNIGECSCNGGGM